MNHPFEATGLDSLTGWIAYAAIWVAIVTLQLYEDRTNEVRD